MKLSKPKIRVNLKKIYIVVLTIALTIICLPSFSFNIGQSEFNFHSLDLSAINPAFKLGEFRKGTGIYDSTKYFSEVVFAETIFQDQKDIEFKKILSTLENRKVLSGLYDIKIEGHIVASAYQVSVEIPEYYPDQATIAGFLTGKGNIVFSKNFQDENALEVNLKIEDVEGFIANNYNEQYGNILEFRFKESAKLNLTLASSASSGYFLMAVDSTFYAITRNPQVDTSVFAVPFADVQTSESSFVINRIVKSYFATQEITTPINVIADKTELVKSEYKNERIRNIVYVFVLAILLLILGFILYRGKKNSIKFILSFATFVGLYIFLLKFSYAVMSLELVIGSLMVFVLFGNLIFSFITSIHSEKDYEILKSQRLLAFGIILLSFVAYRIVFSLTTLVDILGALSIGGIAYICLSYIYLNFIKDEDFF